jgi:dihydroneopterin aldolase
MDSLHLTGLVTNSLIGVYPSEQTLRQPLRLDLTLLLDTRKAGRTDRLKYTIDYARLSGEIRFLLEKARFSLLESAAEALASYVLAPSPPGLNRVPIQGAVVELSKTRARNGSLSTTVKIQRSRDDIPMEVEERPFGKVDILYASKKCGIYRLRIAPGRSIPTHVHRIMDESEMILTKGVLLQGNVPLIGSARDWPKDFPHRYDNPTEKEQVILCIDRPRFIPEDEILVDVPLDGLRDIAAEKFYNPQSMQHD